MNAFNRLILLIVALLLIAVPVLILLVAFGVLSAGLIAQYTGYNAALQAISGLSASTFTTGVRAIIAVIGALVALIALLLLLRELTAGRRSPGARNGRHAWQGDRHHRRRREDAGGWCWRARPGSEPLHVALLRRRRLTTSPADQGPGPGNFTEVATRSRENIRRVLDDQGVPVKDVEVTVRGTAS